jgi:hypothetical protein
MMDDLRPDLERLADGLELSPDAMERLRDRRHRKVIRQRIVAGTTAGVLALGATAAVWVALSGAGEAPPVTTYAPPRVPTVWPESGLEGQETAQVIQYRADNQDPEVVWRLDPDKVVHAFVASVLGWSQPQIREMEPGAAGTFRWYAATERQPCPAETLGCAFVPPGHSPTLRIGVTQPATRGEAGIWSVATVRSSDLRLAVWADDPPRAGTIHGVAAPGTGLRTLAGAQWYDGCAAGHDIVDDIHRPSRFKLTLPDPVAAAGPGCGSVAAGYSYAYAVQRLTQPVGDPLLESAPLTDLTIVPIRVQVAGESTASSGLARRVEPVAPKLPPVPWTAYQDPLGWSIAFPPGWGYEPIQTQESTGVIITNDPDALLHPNGIPQHDVLLLSITHARVRKPERLPADDGELPASLEWFVLHANAEGTRSPADGMSAFRGSGFTFGSGITFGRNMDPGTMRTLDRVLGTLRFPSLVPGERTGDAPLLVLPFAAPPRGKAVIQQPRDNPALMVVHAAGGLYALALDMASFPDLSSWGWDAAIREVTYGDIRWSWDGVPLDLDTADPLETYPVAVGWDGHLMVKTENTALNPGYWP